VSDRSEPATGQQASTGALGGSSLLPLGVLSGLNLVDEFDRVAFSALSPEIRDAFGLDDTDIQLLIIVPAMMLLLLAAPIGWLADRYSRVVISIMSAVFWGVASVATGLVPSAALLLVVRILSGIGRNANEIVHPSLLSDLYPPASHPRVFLVHRLANPASQLSGIAAGWLGAQLGWRWPFYLIAIPTFALALALLAVRDPGRRGLAERRDVVRLGVGETVRRLTAVRSLRRSWATAFALAVAAFGMFALASLYFEQVWGYGPKGRGLVQAVIGGGWMAGVAVGGRLADRLVHGGRIADLATLCGNAFFLFALGGIGLAVSPADWLAVVAVAVLAMANGVWQSPYYSVLGRIAPAGLSGQAFGSAVLAYALGGFGALPIGQAGDRWGYRWGFVLIAGAGLAAALLARSVAPLLRADVAASLAARGPGEDPSGADLVDRA